MLSLSKSKAKKNLRNLLKKLSIINYQLSTAATSNRAQVYAEPVEAKSLKVQSKSLENDSSRLLDYVSTELKIFSSELK